MDGVVGNLGHQIRLFRQLFDPSPAHVALLDLKGIILQTNAAWNQYGQVNGLTQSYSFIGKSYLGFCNSTGNPQQLLIAQQAYIGLQAVLRTQQPKFTMVYPCHSPNEQRWFRMWVQPQTPAMPAIIVAHYECPAPPEIKTVPVPVFIN